VVNTKSRGRLLAAAGGPTAVDERDSCTTGFADPGNRYCPAGAGHGLRHVDPRLLRENARHVQVPNGSSWICARRRESRHGGLVQSKIWCPTVILEGNRFMAFTVELDCPGTRDNKVIIKTDLDLNVGGLNDLSNSGTCRLFVGALDAAESVLQDIPIEPGDFIDHFQPPSGAVSIYAVCDKTCDGTAILTYDDPDLVA
jgi:hypothetical protein